MMKNYEEIKEVCFFIVCLLVTIILIVFTFKIRNTQDRIDQLEKQIMTEQTLEQPITEVTTEVTTELHIEPGDDEIVISINGEDE
jgi:cell division protein FtsL